MTVGLRRRVAVVAVVALVCGLLAIVAVGRADARNCHATKSCPPPVTTTTSRGVSTTTNGSNTTVRVTSTTLKILTTTTLVACLAGCTPLWHAGFETGNLSEVTANGGGNMENSGCGTAAVSTEQAKAGTHSLKATLSYPACDGNSPGVRMFRWDEPRVNRDAYYSVDYFLPSSPKLNGPNQFYNIFQWKSRSDNNSQNDPVIAFYLQHDAAQNCWFIEYGYGWGATTLAGPHAGGSTDGSWIEPITRKCVPIGQWFHLTGFLHQSSYTTQQNYDGSFTFALDGVQLYNESATATGYFNDNWNSWHVNNEWSANEYSDGISPNPFSAFMDEGDISKP